MKNNLRELRNNKRLTQEQLAGILGVTRQTIIAIENNKYDPTLRLALKIARFFATPLEEIFTPDGCSRDGLRESPGGRGPAPADP